MTRDKNLFFYFSSKKRGFVSYDDNNNGRIIGIINVGKFPSSTIGNVVLVDDLKHILLCISQLCVKGKKI